MFGKVAESIILPTHMYFSLFLQSALTRKANERCTMPKKFNLCKVQYRIWNISASNAVAEH